MTPTLIVVVNEIGREKTAFYLRPLAKHPAPNIPDGEHRAYLQWQWFDPTNKTWENDTELGHKIAIDNGFKTRAKWILVEEKVKQPEMDKSDWILAEFSLTGLHNING